MTRDDLLIRYVQAALAARDATGETPDLDELCREHPELIAGVREALELESDLDSAAAADDPLVDQVLNGRYRLEHCIGIGAMGAVYEATDRTLSRTVAIKILQPDVLGKKGRRERFDREARILAALDHEHVVPIHDLGRTDTGLQYLVMERLQGVSLALVLERSSDREARELPPKGWLNEQFDVACGRDDYLPQIVAWMVDVVDALRVAHDAGVFHRDVKPSNVFLRTTGEAVLLDFGIAARVGEAAITTRGSALGTPWYMAPEQADRGEVATAAMDVYGVCATLYHLVSMRPPYEGDSADVIAQLKRDDPPPLEAVAPPLPTDLRAIIEKGMERDLARRYATVADLDDDLRAFLAHLPVKARPITRGARLLRRIRRRPGRVVAAIAVAFALVATAVGTVVWRDAEDRRVATHARRFAAIPPYVALEGSVERRLTMNVDERRGYIRALTAVLEADPSDVWSRMLRAALLQDDGRHDASADDVEVLAGRASSPYLTAIVARYRAVPVDGLGIGALDRSDLPEPTTDVGRFIAAFHRARLHEYPAADALLARVEPTDWPARYLRIGVRLNWVFGPLELEADPFEMLREIGREALALEGAAGGYGATARTRYIAGTAFLALRDHVAATVHLERANELSPGAFGPLNNLGLAYRRQRRFAEAERVLREAIALRPWNQNASLQLADLISIQGGFDEAIALLDRLGDGDQIAPTDLLLARVDAHRDRYLALAGAGRDGEARELARRAIEIADEALARIPESAADERAGFERRRLSATYFLDRDASYYFDLATALESRPLDHFYLAALEEQMSRTEPSAESWAAVRAVLRAAVGALEPSGR